MSQPTIADADIRRVLRAACARHTDRDSQLSILARALACACKSMSVPKAVMDRELEKVWGDQEPLKRLIIIDPGS